MRGKWLFDWGAICSVIAIGLGYLFTNPWVQTGSQVNLQLSDNLYIEVKGASRASFSSPSFFTLRNGNAFINSQSMTVPLGWPSRERWTAESGNFTGRWTVEVGKNITTRIESDGPNEVIAGKPESQKPMDYIVALLCSMGIFFIGWLLASLIVADKRK